MKKLTIYLALATAILITGCGREASRASYNLSRDADEFRIHRRVTVFNDINDTALFTVEGNCSFETLNRKLVLTCKQGINLYKKHTIGMGDNTSFVIEQLDFVTENPYRFKIIFKPEQVFSLPNIEVK